MGAYLTDGEIERLTEKTISKVFKKQGTQQMLQNHISNLKNRCTLLKNNNDSLKREISDLKFELNRLRKSKTKKEPLAKNIRHKVFEKYNHRCCECGATHEDIMLTIDHIIPRSKGGTDDISNLQVLCAACNMDKGNNTWEQPPLPEIKETS